MKPVLILTAGFGEGHNAAARNLAEAFRELQGNDQAADVQDLFALASPRLNAISRKTYLGLINRAPRVWSAFYEWIDKSKAFPRHLWFLRKEMREFERLLLAKDYASVCSAYPVYGFMADKLRERGLLKVPFVNVVTDSISINSLWTRPACDAWYVPNPETSACLVQLGVPSDKILDLGFPVQGFFLKNRNALTPPPLSEGFRPKVLYILNSGVLHAEATARLLADNTDWELTFAVGHDKGLYKRLADCCRQRKAPTTLLSWTNRIPELLMTHHAVISKAGGATTQEALAACCPMIVNQIVPGQEEGNYEILRRRSIGAYAKSPEEVLSSLQTAFAERGVVWSQWRQSILPLSRPEAARSIAQAILGKNETANLQVPSR